MGKGWVPDGRVCDSYYIGGSCTNKATFRYLDCCGYWLYSCDSCGGRGNTPTEDDKKEEE